MQFQRGVYGEHHKDCSWYMLTSAPIKPVSNSKKRYFISFIDDYSHKVWIYFLAENSEAFTIFKNYKNLVEKET
jgi:hypothetical protein